MFVQRFGETPKSVTPGVIGLLPLTNTGAGAARGKRRGGRGCDRGAPESPTGEQVHPQHPADAPVVVDGGAGSVVSPESGQSGGRARCLV